MNEIRTPKNEPNATNGPEDETFKEPTRAEVPQDPEGVEAKSSI